MNNAKSLLELCESLDSIKTEFSGEELADIHTYKGIDKELSDFRYVNIRTLLHYIIEVIEGIEKNKSNIISYNKFVKDYLKINDDEKEKLIKEFESTLGEKAEYLTEYLVPIIISNEINLINKVTNSKTKNELERNLGNFYDTLMKSIRNKEMPKTLLSKNEIDSVYGFDTSKVINYKVLLNNFKDNLKNKF